tara:strand:- start:719 stop:973 length:255 start_codon:yes stop_codon:yes gene_type:complete
MKGQTSAHRGFTALLATLLLLTAYRLAGSDKATYVETWLPDLFRLDPDRDIDAKKLSFWDWIVYIVAVIAAIGVSDMVTRRLLK